MNVGECTTDLCSVFLCARHRNSATLLNSILLLAGWLPPPTAFVVVTKRRQCSADRSE